MSNLDTNLKDVKDEQTKHAAKQTAEVKQLKEHHQQQQVKIEKFEKDQAETGGKLDNLKEDHDTQVKDVDVMHGKLTAELNEHLHNFDNRLTNKEKDIKKLSDDQETQRQKLGDLETKAIGWDNKFTTLETDFGHLKSQQTKHDDMFLKLPTLQTNNDHATQDLKQIKGKQDTTIQDVHSLKVGLGQTQTDLKHTYEGLNKVDAKAEKIHTGINDLQQRVTTLEAGKGGGPNWGVVIGGGIAAVMAVGGLVGGFLWWKKRKAAEGAGDGNGVSSDAGNGSKGRRRNQANRNHAREWYPAFD
jgi:chromosome segregation ATPase